MSTKMLINATRGGQLRVAIVEGTILQEFQVEVTEDDQTRGNIYRGVVANIQPSLNAAFVDLGEERHGFLPAGDVLPCAYHSKPPKDARRPNISQVLEKGKPILVQVTKDGVGQKGPALSTNLALAGRYLVLTPFDAVRGISRKAQDDAARKKIRERLKKLELPDDHGVIVRTNGLDQNQQTLSRDLNALLRLWKKVKTEAGRGRGAKLVYSDQDLVMQALRDYLDASISEVVVDNDEVFAKAEAFMKAFMPRSKTQLVRYEDRLPLFSRYRLETQIDRIYERTAPLPSGGGIVIDQTEALTAIDVNSGRATKTTNHDESIFKINCEAAKEVGRQLRLRDIGGLVVVDFIDMRLRKHQNRLERVMRDAMKRDNARHSVARISPNGLLEINRQRIKQSLRLRTHRSCPTCSGAGATPTPEFAALRLLSRIEARAASGLVQSVTLALHPEIADTVQNHYRAHLAAIETDHGIVIEILAASNLSLNEERVEWVQREGGAAPSAPVKTRRAVNAADLTPPERKAGAKDDEESEERSEAKSGGGRRRRRRRRRSRRGGEAPDAASDKQEAAADREAAESGADKNGTRESDPEVSAGQDGVAAKDATDPDGEASKGRVRRRRRRRGRRRPGRDEGEQQADAASQDTEAAEGRRDGEPASSVEAESAESDTAQAEGEDSKGRGSRSRRSRSRRSRSKASEAQLSEDAKAQDSETGDAQDSAAQDSAAQDSAAQDSEAQDSKVARSRSSRSRRRRAPKEAAAVAEDANDQETAVEAEAEAEADGDEAQEPARKVRRRRRRRPRSRRGEQAADATSEEATEAVAEAGHQADGEAHDALEDRNFDDKQPESNASALHEVTAPHDPFVEALTVETPATAERPVSQRLRWQWWGGVQAAAEATDGEAPEAQAEPQEASADEVTELAADALEAPLEAPEVETVDPVAAVAEVAEEVDDVLEVAEEEAEEEPTLVAVEEETETEVTAEAEALAAEAETSEHDDDDLETFVAVPMTDEEVEAIQVDGENIFAEAVAQAPSFAKKTAPYRSALALDPPTPGDTTFDGQAKDLPPESA